MAKRNRGRLYVDKDVQRALLSQLVRHWAMFIAILTGMLVALQSLSPNRPQSLGQCLQATWEQHAPLFVLIVVLFPVFAYDSIKLSHRFVGPVLRVRGAIRQAARGERVSTLSFRKNDFWQEMAGDMNTLLARLPENAASGFVDQPTSGGRALAISAVPAAGDDSTES